MTRPDDDTIKRMHRWFAVECNNATWDLSEKKGWSEEEQRTFLAAAYASAFHWEQVGEPINRARADMLLAHTHAQLGEGKRALYYAQAAVSLLEPAQATDWDHAFAHLVFAYAAGISGNKGLLETEWKTAETRGKLLKDPDDQVAFSAAMEKTRTALAGAINGTKIRQVQQ